MCHNNLSGQLQFTVVSHFPKSSGQEFVRQQQCRNASLPQPVTVFGEDLRLQKGCCTKVLGTYRLTDWGGRLKES